MNFFQIFQKILYLYIIKFYVVSFLKTPYVHFLRVQRIVGQQIGQPSRKEKFGNVV